MSLHVANSAAQSNPSLNAPRVLIASFGRHYKHRSMPSSREAFTRQEWAAVWRNYCRREAKADFGALRDFPASNPVLYSGSRFRAYPAPCGTALFCFGFAALRVTVSVYDGPSANAELGTWEPGPLARLCRE